MENGLKTAAFFDFDRTLLKVESAELGFKWAWKNRQVSLPYILRVYFTAKLFQKNRVTMENMTKLCLRYYIGRDMRPLIEGSPQFYETWLKPRLCPAMLKKLEEHRRAGHVLVLLTGSLDYLMGPVVKELGFDHLLCSVIEVDADGKGTGRTAGPMLIGEEKLRAAQRLAACEGIDLSASYAYADHHTDIPLFEAVGHPVAIRPTATLEKKARERQWEILEEG